MSTYQKAIISHYEQQWGTPEIYLWDKGPLEKMPYNFRILEFKPTSKRGLWTYATCCMSQPEDLNHVELHLFSQIKDEGLIELLTAVAYYHRNTHLLNINDSVNFGRPWQQDSIYQYGFISLPYLDGPSLENNYYFDKIIKFYWLIPISEAEVNYKKKHGIEALETKFDQGLNYADPSRPSSI